MNGLLEIANSSEPAGGKASELMEHHEAIEMMASERYLLNELTPELRDAYEDHMFSCTECANDARFGAAFIDHTKVVLPEWKRKQAPLPARLPLKAEAEKRDWFAWLRPAWLSPAWLSPALMAPAFACLLAIVGYQNLVVYPVLQASSVEPRLLPPATVLHGDVRSSLPIVYADLISGSTLNIPLPQNSGQNPAYASFRLDFYDSKGKLIWSHSLSGAAASDDMLTVWLPGRVKEDSYKLALSGVTVDGRNIPIQQQFFDLRIRK